METLQDTHWESISLFSSLEELFMLCHADITHGEGHSAVSAYIVPLLEHLPPQDALRTVIIQIYIHQDDSRGRFLRALSSNKVDELLNKFTKLESLCFWLEESRASGYDAERWRSLLNEHLPKLRGNVTISVKIEWMGSRCWDDDTDLDDMSDQDDDSDQDEEAPKQEHDALDIGDDFSERSYQDEDGALFEDHSPHIDSGSLPSSASNDELNNEASIAGGTRACVEASTQ
ncbi:hypothetical protein C8T65DRAFT_696328 [Cerioporus squamosus]|nr:hypothetical protein C8T65DRAFT_696328 [Cerioporus squamosus]